MLLISAADKLHNVRSLLQDYRLIGESLWSCFQGGKDGTLWYYRTISDAFKKIQTTAIVEELTRVVKELEDLVESRGNGGAEGAK